MGEQSFVTVFRELLFCALNKRAKLPVRKKITISFLSFPDLKK